LRHPLIRDGEADFRVQGVPAPQNRRFRTITYAGYGDAPDGREKGISVVKIMVLVCALSLAAAAVSPALAQSWGAPQPYGQPPVYYAPGVYQRAVPLSPDAVFDLLDAAGYREFGPMAPREPIYRLNAVNRRGELVALEVSMFTGRIERERVLALRESQPLPAYRPQASVGAPQPVPTPAPRPASPGARDPLVIY
jgi:hypothetical protein